MSSSPVVPVSLAEIARLAGVGRAAVSNWRRRHPGFPERIGGTDVRPEFSMTEVETWLRTNGKIKKSAEREWLWPRFEALGDRDLTGRVISAVGHALADEAPCARRPEGTRLTGDARALMERAVDLGRREGARATLEFLVRRWLDVHVRQITTTPEPLAALMAALAFRTAAAGDGRESAPVAMDPACGTGHLLAAAAEAGAAVLMGGDRDPVLAALADARLRLAVSDGLGGDDVGRTATDVQADAQAGVRIDVRVADTLRTDPFAGVPADVVLCNPPFNERDWGYEELATDGRWSHGLPPRTEPELAWVQHCLAGLRPGGSAVLLLPPAVASRRAGRRIRGSLLRTGHLRAVVALPPGCAAPHSVSLQLWVLRTPVPRERLGAGGRVLLVDAASRFPRESSPAGSPDWAALAPFVRAAFDRAEVPEPEGADLPWPDYVAAVPVIDLLDDEVDLTPGRHVAPPAADKGRRLADTWEEFGKLVTAMGRSGRRLAALGLATGAAESQPATTVAELARAGALSLRAGQQPAEGTVLDGRPTGDGIPLLTLPDLMIGEEPRGWLTAEEAANCQAAVAEAGDVVVVGAARRFSAWVHEGPPVALGPQLYAIRVQPAKLDAGFLAGSLRAPANARQAGTHTSSSSRVDVRRLQVRQLPLTEQQRYGAAFGDLAEFDRLVRQAGGLGEGLVRDLSDELAAGGLPGTK